MIDPLLLNNWLSQTLLFSGLSESEVMPFTQIAKIQNFAKSEMVFNQGNPAIGFFIVKMGKVKVFKVSANGKEQIVHIFQLGDYFAEVPALDGQPFPNSAAALEPTELVFFPRELFLKVLHQSPTVSVNLLTSLCQHLRELTSLIDSLSFQDVPQRLAAYLLNLSNRDFQQINSGRETDRLVTLDINKGELASLLGTIPATLSRAFAKLSQKGLIAVNGSQIQILNHQGLQEFSQSLID
ncbi:MAG: Crp/Fnr family transcriptional regulator [Limnospira sp. PMC 1291.21]|uniref:Crp/Fnr family transcriptional regulator n=1 Tax=unclassified Limnospira TaxID=2642885 RepID=UPI0028E113B5|nr:MULTISPECIES: Crp/Fnr family transcriptional regulator [unclassified Limnospira]MDT9176252.1 Crp/Fnr family transcriptional regulator [Limnospira sp. PMC 1238.20]MDT9191558.1 Crp/Fnr family transcriptional regulator [Limnospira sp. PMC 1245.20]MDT9201749.1 Crp/Fnr family transcriptional regulator [Limnospira sp. PMC 1243.20]MDT9207104.1 Crp/Fnr family transcriptional regulator [Limnospira sp. PMC 1252.20]MDT9212169.1 Crp/Fnr family transcriptional regulator [Limnospira sp. PMC 1256.20]